MKDLNHFVCVGRLTKDSEIHKFNEDSGVMQFSIAVNTSKKDGDKYIDEGNFFNCRMYGKNSYLDKMAKMLVKGKQVAIDGYLKQDRWEKDGQKNSAILIMVEFLELLGGGKRESDDSNGFQEDLPYESSSGPVPF